MPVASVTVARRLLLTINGRIALARPPEIRYPDVDLREKIASIYYEVQLVPEGSILVDQARREIEAARGTIDITVYIYRPNE